MEDSRDTKTRRVVRQGDCLSPEEALEGYNLERPAFGMEESDFVALRDQVYEIEQQLTYLELFYKIDSSSIREEVQEILRFPTFAQKMVELGLLCYTLITKPNDLVKKSSSRFKQCVEKLEMEVKNNPIKDTAKKLFFLKFSFVKMALFEKSGKMIALNKGGLLAIRALLENSTVALHFRDEHRRHMLCVVNTLLSHPLFPTRLDNTVAVAPEMQEILRLDLNLDFQEACRPIHAHFSVLLTLFADYRQGSGEPNCYAIGALISLTQRFPLLFYSRLLELVTTGKWREQDGKKFPLFPLISEFFDENQEIEESDFSNINSAIEASSILTELVEEEYEMKTDMQDGTNWLQKLLLRVAEFNQCNAKKDLSHLGERLRVDKSDKYGFYFPKDLFVNNSISGMKEHFTRDIHVQMTNGHCNVFFMELEAKFRSVLWMCSRKTEATFEWDFPEFLDKHPYYVRLFYLDEEVDHFAMLGTIENASAVLSEVVEGVIDGLSIEETLRNKLHSAAQGFLYSIQFRQVCKESSIQTTEEEKEKAWTKEVMEEAELLFFSKHGGFGEDVFRTFGVSFAKVAISSESCENFVSQLHNKLRSIEAFTSQAHGSAFLVQSPCHAFTFNPDISSWFWKDYDPSKILTEVIKLPGEVLLKSSFSIHNQKRVLDAINMFIDVPLTVETISSNTEIPLREFRDRVLTKLKKSKREIFFRILNETVKRIHSENFTEEKISAIFKFIGIRMNEQQLKEVVAEIQTDSTAKYFLPHTYAIKLNKQIVKCGFPFQNLGFLEHAIVRAFSHPSVVDIGDSNHSGVGNYEKPSHLRWIVGFDYGRGKLDFIYREKDRENGFSKEDKRDLLSNFQIFLPK